ncbi:MAG: pentapeptide repeat-containing protein [Clostridia bacterium]|nr:pentapeptide repeat-containing protein [Clostridia bacterium]
MQKIKSYEGKIFKDVALENKTLLNHEFEDCVFEGCSFVCTTFKGCVFKSCTFVRCRLADVKNEGSDFKECTFKGCNLLSISWADVFTRNSVMPSVARLEGCCIKYGVFSHVNFGKFDFSGNDVVDSMFSDCRLSRSSFKDCNLKFTEFLRCDITEADFRGASGYKVELATCKMKGARFSFPEVVNLLNGLGIEIE